MKYKWLNKQKNEKLIIFFNGWGMDENVVKHLDAENYDIIMFYDYNSLDIDLSQIENYNKKYVISWSMGVMAGTNFNLKPISATAINGTLKPIDSDYGINPRIYDLTIKGFNKIGRKKFIKNMFDKSVEIEITRDLENQKTELEALKNYTAGNYFEYNKIFISDNDKIIPTKNQTNFWNIEPNLKSGHCPFFIFKKWSEIL